MFTKLVLRNLLFFLDSLMFSSCSWLDTLIHPPDLSLRVTVCCIVPFKANCELLLLLCILAKMQVLLLVVMLVIILTLLEQCISIAGVHQ